MTTEANLAYELGKEEMRERIIALIAHHMDVAKTFHGRDSEAYLRYRNLIEDLREDMVND
jgi:hypothetical protein